MHISRRLWESETETESIGFIISWVKDVIVPGNNGILGPPLRKLTTLSCLKDSFSL